MNRMLFVCVGLLISIGLFAVDRPSILRDIDAKFELASNDKDVVDLLSLLLVEENNPFGIDASFSTRVLEKVREFPYRQRVFELVTVSSKVDFTDIDLLRLMELGDPTLLGEVWEAQKQLDEADIARKIASFDSRAIDAQKETEIVELSVFTFRQTAKFQHLIVKLLETLVGPAVAPDKRRAFEDLVSYIKQAYTSESTEFSDYLVLQNKYIYQNTKTESLREVNRLHKYPEYVKLVDLFGVASLDATAELIRYVENG